MNLTRHCTLCKNQITSLDIGTTCKLTKKAPDFHKTCSNINLDEKFERDLHLANLEMHLILKNKNVSYLKIFIVAITGALIIIGNELLTIFLQPLRYYWVYRTALIGAGVLVFINANFRLQGFLNQLRSARFKKGKIDKVLGEYGIKYKSFFNYKDEIHGNQEIEITIEYQNWIKQRTTTTYTTNC